jgi:DNA-binding XRE family transcriptional regulator
MFTKIVQEIIKSGLTEMEIAKKVNSTQPTINRIRNGKTKPMGELGIALVALRKTRERYLKELA